MLICESRTRKGILIHYIFKKINKNKCNDQAERSYCEETSQTDTRFPSEELQDSPATESPGSSVQPLQGMCGTATPAAAQTEREETSHRNNMLPLLGRGTEGKEGGRAGVIVITSHGPASAHQSAGTGLHKAFALPLFLIPCPATSKTVSFAKAMKYGFK